MILIKRKSKFKIDSDVCVSAKDMHYSEEDAKEVLSGEMEFGIYFSVENSVKKYKEYNLLQKISFTKVKVLDNSKNIIYRRKSRFFIYRKILQ